ncbi:MAG: PilZ domain-containing protein [Deltaproteobacteria bacterium]|nr:PilZ domain-containing protein [Deltaproteobacteria bacterium]
METFERRKNKRKKITSGIAALLLPDKSQVVTIDDVSPDGLSFICPECDLSVDGSVEMDVLIMDSDVFFPNVSCVVISKTVCGGSLNCAASAMKRCGVKFNALTPDELFLLNRLFPVEERMNAPL